MTTLGAFKQTLPDGADLALQAIWWAGQGDWNTAHERAQQDEGNPDCDLVHAHLHRVEGDASNARYWYRRAGEPVPDTPLDEEWASIARRLLARAATSGQPGPGSL